MRIAPATLLLAAVAMLSACGEPTATQKFEQRRKDCREAVDSRAAQGEFGNQEDETFLDRKSEAYEDCAYN